MCYIPCFGCGKKDLDRFLLQKTYLKIALFECENFSHILILFAKSVQKCKIFAEEWKRASSDLHTIFW